MYPDPTHYFFEPKFFLASGFFHLLQLPPNITGLPPREKSVAGLGDTIWYLSHSLCLTLVVVGKGKFFGRSGAIAHVLSNSCLLHCTLLSKSLGAQPTGQNSAAVRSGHGNGP